MSEGLGSYVTTDHIGRIRGTYTFMFDELHWLPLHARIQFKILTLIFKAQSGLAPKHLVDVILRPHSASSHRRLRSCSRLDLLVPRTRTAMAQSRSFASVGPSFWNALSPPVRSKILSGSLSSSFAFLKTCFFSRGLAHCMGALLNGSPYERRFTNV